MPKSTLIIRKGHRGIKFLEMNYFYIEVKGTLKCLGMDTFFINHNILSYTVADF